MALPVLNVGVLFGVNIGFAALGAGLIGAWWILPVGLAVLEWLGYRRAGDRLGLGRGWAIAGAGIALALALVISAAVIVVAIRSCSGCLG